ncbi:hypothetical protein BD560DRAFT_443348 [Blakeslea trispora]|nr:hypothetical protein BD560DRAFT_443348 [Blakeslea trispora]
MTTNDISDEYMHCFSISDETPGYEPMELEEQASSLVDTSLLPHSLDVKLPLPSHIHAQMLLEIHALDTCFNLEEYRLLPAPSS